MNIPSIFVLSHSKIRMISCIYLLGFGVQLMAHDDKLETLVVDGRQINLLGDAVSSSEGVVGQNEIAIRPISRTGEVLELVPGMVVTQHSGSGKANQYFLRGFNLDHGTDFATYIDDMPVNMRSHGHGQGYTDINFLIPETVGKIAYKKGAYYADVGDFSGAGAAHISTAETFKQGVVQLSFGEFGFQRALLLDSFDTANSSTLFALEGQRYDGPWSDISEDVEKINFLGKHILHLDGKQHLSFTAMAYDNQWNSADQIPLRAVEIGIIDEFGSLDDTVGGETSRYSFNVNYRSEVFEASAYIIDYRLNLWSNFTYFLENEDTGDQFEQVDDRVIFGGKATYLTKGLFKDLKTTNRFGVEWRADDIEEVGLYQTQARERLAVVRSDAVQESSFGAFWENRIQWTENLRSVVGLRYDYFDFDVDNLAELNFSDVDLNENSGQNNDDLLSAKASLVYLFDNAWEAYASIGQGFHSNDARGTTIQVDPTNGSPVDSVDPLVRSFGYELGARGFISDQLNTSITVWALELDSELLFVGDAGNTEASFGTERKGIELTAYYRFSNEWSLDIEYAYADGKFVEFDEGVSRDEDQIPGAISNVFQAGLNADFSEAWYGSLRLRHFGRRPLTEDGSVQSDSTTTWNARFGYRSLRWDVVLDILNLTDSDDHDIDYFYESRLATEASGVATEDIHFHVIEPRSLRVSVAYKF